MDYNPYLTIQIFVGVFAAEFAMLLVMQFFFNDDEEGPPDGLA